MVTKKVDHFLVSHPLGMHARVCSRWIKKIQTLRLADWDCLEEWVWIAYQDGPIPADSLFKLLETRIPCGAEFDLLMDELCSYNKDVGKELAFIISQDAFERSE
ncbi:hypothetical protein AGMMS49949_02010 [Alphaproteobacteria bacterium]|nr:hypothetical protein AGMMS49949_02010 [Alphaproteobacteria bacterium]GHS95890.1 hypothetical protein AGMMS50296_1330 [Alphaproteobacteria bacterium]